MAAVHIETRIRAPAQQVWQALAATGDAHLAFAGVLKDCRLEREDVRVATFANGHGRQGADRQRRAATHANRVRRDRKPIRLSQRFDAGHGARRRTSATSSGSRTFCRTRQRRSITPLMEQGARALQGVMEKRSQAEA